MVEKIFQSFIERLKIFWPSFSEFKEWKKMIESKTKSFFIKKPPKIAERKNSSNALDLVSILPQGKEKDT